MCLLCYCVIHLAKAQTGTNAKDLRKKLFVTDEYDKRVRSANNQTVPTGKSITRRSAYKCYPLFGDAYLSLVAENACLWGFRSRQGCTYKSI